jgi:hypothetical protein
VPSSVTQVGPCTFPPASCLRKSLLVTSTVATGPHYEPAGFPPISRMPKLLNLRILRAFAASLSVGDRGMHGPAYRHSAMSSEFSVVHALGGPVGSAFFILSALIMVLPLADRFSTAAAPGTFHRD